MPFSIVPLLFGILPGGFDGDRFQRLPDIDPFFWADDLAGSAIVETAVQTMRIGSAGVTEKSLWFEKRRPFAKADAMGLRKEGSSLAEVLEVDVTPEEGVHREEARGKAELGIGIDLFAPHKLGMDDNCAAILNPRAHPLHGRRRSSYRWRHRRCNEEDLGTAFLIEFAHSLIHKVGGSGAPRQSFSPAGPGVSSGSPQK